MNTRLMNALMYFPLRPLDGSPRDAGLVFDELEITTADGERLHGWWIPARSGTSTGHVLHFHGNAGNVSHRIDVAAALSRAGLDVLLFDYRGYGRSTGTPGVEGTAADARAALATLLTRPRVDPRRVLYLGESLGGGVAVRLATEAAPRGLVLQSTFTSVRDLARLHYPFVPSALVPDAYPSLQLLPRIGVPLLLIHGEEDDIVPLAQGKALFAAHPGPKRLEIVSGAGHNDLLWRAGDGFGVLVADWVRQLPE